MGVGVGINVGEWEQGFGQTRMGGQSGKGVNSIRFRLRAGRE